MHQRAPLCRVMALLAALTAAAGAAGRAARPVMAAAVEQLHAGTATPPDVQLSAALVLLGGAGALLAWCWLQLCLVVALFDVVGQLLGSRHSRPMSHAGPLRPVLLRSLIGIACVGAGTLTVPAHAAQPADPAQPSTVHALLDGLLLPERVADRGPEPSEPPSELRSPPPTPTRQDGHPCRVRPGDTLWGLAEELLERRGATPTAPDVDRAWRHLHHANRAVLGADPDLIRPGTLLRVPISLSATNQPTGTHR